MRISLHPFRGLLLLCVLVQTTQTQSLLTHVGSGSGDLPQAGAKSTDVDTQPGDIKDVDDGSGQLTTTSATLKGRFVSVTTAKSVITDDEDGDTVDDIVMVGPSSSGDGPTQNAGQDIGSGDLEGRNMKCTETYLYCWCVDDSGAEVQGTRTYIGELKKGMNCAAAIKTTTILPQRSTEPTASTTASTTVKRYETPSTEKTDGTIEPIHVSGPPFVVDADSNDDKHDGSDKFGKGDYQDNAIREGVDKDGIIGEYNVVEKRKILPLLDHPGIMAAVIGGGVVALLCALLLIMFIVYRMRKKDEGSYPLDKDAKPPRLHTYTRAPNKEIFA